jgi:hypothetical protein
MICPFQYIHHISSVREIVQHSAPHNITGRTEVLKNNSLPRSRYTISLKMLKDERTSATANLLRTNMNIQIREIYSEDMN